MLLILLSTFYLFVIHILQKYFKSATHKMMNKQWLFINISLLLLSITFKKKNEFKHVLIFLRNHFNNFEGIRIANIILLLS